MIEKEILDKTFKQITEKKPKQVFTGFKELDPLLLNIENGSLITIGGRPAMGKTSFITSIICNLMKQKKKCLLFSLDTSTNLFIKRLIANIGEIDLCGLSYTEFLKDKRIDDIQKSIDTISEFDLTIYDDIDDIDKIKEKIEAEKPEFVFIDYLQLLNIPPEKQRNEVISNMMLKFKNIAKENNCIIYIASQLSRAIESRCNKRPLLCDLKESGDIENISDVVMFIYRDEYYKWYHDENDSYTKGEAEIIVAKHKMGSVGTVKLLFRSPIAKFLDPLICDEF